MAEPRERELQRTRSHPIEDYISLRCPSIPRVLETNERVTGHAALEMVTASRLMSAHSSESVKVLDNASGAGILPSVIRQLQKEEAIRANVSIVAADKDPMYIAQLQERQKANQEQWADIGIKQFDMQVRALGPLSASHRLTNIHAETAVLGQRIRHRVRQHGDLFLPR